MLRTRRLVSRPDQFTRTNVERHLRNVQERSLHACRRAEYESKTLQDGDHAIAQLQLGTCKLMSTGGYRSFLLVNANVIGMVRTARSTRQSLHATPHSLEEAHADLHILQGHSTVAQLGCLGEVVLKHVRDTCMERGNSMPMHAVEIIFMHSLMEYHAKLKHHHSQL
jgi:hypothetical protein